jgi:hypothetical protein
MDDTPDPTSIDNHEENKSERDGLSDCDEIVKGIEKKDSEKIGGNDGNPTNKYVERRDFRIECEGCMAEPEVDDDELCVRCKNFPWRSLIDVEPDQDSMVLAIPQEEDTLLQSSCRIGRFFGTVKKRHRWCLWNDRNSRFRRIQSELGLSSQTSVLSSPMHGNEHIIITGLRPEVVQSSLRHLYPQQLNSRLLSTWLRICTIDHDTCCQPSSSESLIDLRFIDCKNRTVTRSPPNPQFLALSYMWGSQPTKLYPMNDLLSNLPERLPQVIEDAVSLTLSLGYQYLWVDRYVRSC